MIGKLSWALPDRLASFFELSRYSELEMARDFVFDVIFDHVQSIFLGLQLVIILCTLLFLFCTLVNNTWFIALSPLAFLAFPPLFFVYFLLVPMSIVFLLSFLQFSVFFFSLSKLWRVSKLETIVAYLKIEIPVPRPGLLPLPLAPSESSDGGMNIPLEFLGQAPFPTKNQGISHNLWRNIYA